MLTPANAGSCVGGAGGSIVGVIQVFNYTFTGAEGTHFAVALPVARGDNKYGVTFGPQTEPDTFGFSWDTPTLANFMLRTSGQVPAGRKITFIVMELQ